MSAWLAHTGYDPTAYGGSLFWIAHATCAVPCVTRGAIAVPDNHFGVSLACLRGSSELENTS